MVFTVVRVTMRSDTLRLRIINDDDINEGVVDP